MNKLLRGCTFSTKHFYRIPDRPNILERVANDKYPDLSLYFGQGEASIFRAGRMGFEPVPTTLLALVVITGELAMV
jgi:hypothetical protein